MRHVRDGDAFRYVTLLFLLRRRDLSLISVWHPSFLTLLMAALPRFWDSLLHDVERGGLTPPGPPYWEHATMSCTEVGRHVRALDRRLMRDRVALNAAVFYPSLLAYTPDLRVAPPSGTHCWSAPSTSPTGGSTGGWSGRSGPCISPFPEAGSARRARPGKERPRCLTP